MSGPTNITLRNYAQPAAAGCSAVARIIRAMFKGPLQGARSAPPERCCAHFSRIPPAVWAARGAAPATSPHEGGCVSLREYPTPCGSRTCPRTSSKNRQKAARVAKVRLTLGSLFYTGAAPLAVSGLSSALGGEMMIGGSLSIVCAVGSLMGAAVFAGAIRCFPRNDQARALLHRLNGISR